MRIYGQFRDLKENLISVEIIKQETGIQREYEIGDILDSTHHYCFDGKAPVKISRKCDDLFEPIISTSCKIKLRSNRWSGDDLFANGVGDITVKVERYAYNSLTGEDSESPELLFIGYVQPLSFNQNINKQTNIIDINCIDYLGFLKDRYLSTGNSPQDDSAWKLALSQSKYRSFIEIMQKIGIFGTTIGEYVTTMFIKDDANADNTNPDNTNAFATSKYISDNLWLGESADDEMNCQEILLELLKYMNSRIVSVNGRDYYIIRNNNTISISDNVKCYSTSIQPATVPIDNTGVFPKEDIANEQVTIDTCYNKIGVKCDLETVDDVVTSPLEESTLYSDYMNKQKYFTEMGAPTEALLRNMMTWRGITDNLQQIGASEDNVKKCWTKDWYIRVMKSTAWNMRNSFDDPTFEMKGWDNTASPTGAWSNFTVSTQDNTENWMNQFKAAYDLGKWRIFDPERLNYNADGPATVYSNDRMGAYILQYGSGEKHTVTDNAPDGNVSMTTCLVLPINGPWVDGVEPGSSSKPSDSIIAQNEAYASAVLENYFENYENDPMMSYDSTTSVNYKPSDQYTTNYIVISGKFTLTPLFTPEYKYNTENGVVRGLSTNMPLDGLDVAHTSLRECTAKIDDDTRYYYRLLWEKQYVNYSPYVVAPNAIAKCTWFPHIECDKLKDFKYRGSRKANTDQWDVYDRISKIPVLCCKLSIGGKYVSETVDANGNSSFSWSDDSSSFFTIGMNPKIDDMIVGKSWDIASNVTTDMNIDGRGIAIPVTYNDDVKGNIHFEILGPYNTMIDVTTHETHSRWTHFWKGYPRSAWHENEYSLLNHIQSIIIDKFEIKAMSNNAKNSTLNNGDLLYYSEDNKQYNNTKENIEFKISTALTSSEAAEMNVAAGVSYNNPTDSNGNLYTASMTGAQCKPECKYITTMYNLYSTPKKIVEYNCNDEIKVDELYRSVYTCDLMEHLGITGFSTIVLSDEMDLKNNRTKISLRQI